MSFRLHPWAFILAHHRHGTQTFDPGAAQQLQENRFRLVVEVVSERDEIGRQPPESLIACGARRRFETVTSRYRHTHDGQRDRMRLAERTAKCGEAAGSGIDLMVDVQRPGPEG